MTELTTTKGYESLVDELKACMVETRAAANEIIIESHRDMGEIMRRWEKEVPITKLVDHIASDVGVSTKTLWNSLSIFDNWEKLEDVYVKDKSCTVTKLLKAVKTPELLEKECEHKSGYKTFKVCNDCGRRV